MDSGLAPRGAPRNDTNLHLSLAAGVLGDGCPVAIAPHFRRERAHIVVTLRIILQARRTRDLRADNDRAYLAQVVAARTGLPQDEAQRRVADVDTKAREAIKEAADKIAKAGAYFSFWTFMSLLFGGAAATLGAMLGGQLRDAEGRVA